MSLFHLYDNKCNYNLEDEIQIYVEVFEDDDEPEPDYEASTDDGDFTETFRRLQHTCIKHFYFGIRDSPFMRYWKTQETASFTVKKTDYGLLDTIVNHLRPRTTAEFDVLRSSWHENGYDAKNRKYLALLARESFLDNLQTCRLSASDGIGGYIESFVRDGCANTKLESVCIKWHDPEGKQSPALKQLKKPTKIDKPLPENYLTEWYTRYDLRVTQCEMCVLVNAKQRRRMEAYKWTFEYEDDDDEGGRLITAHILQCLMKNL